MKRRAFLKLSAATALAAAASACSGSSISAPTASSVPQAASSDKTASAASASCAVSSSPQEESRALVAYFSATGHTAAVAACIAGATDADLFQLEPVTPYTEADLDYSDPNSRTSQERADPARQDVPLVATAVEGWDTYDTVFVGFPIWWGGAGWPVNGFVTGNDFTGKRVIPFCTSASSGLGQSSADLAALAGTGDWDEGQRFSASASEADVTDWLVGLGLV